MLNILNWDLKNLLLVAVLSIFTHQVLLYYNSSYNSTYYNSSFRSNIINQIQFIKLMDLCRFHAWSEFRLLYRGSRDGFSAYDFHANCDGIKNTLTIIKTTEGYIFGGYTGAAWSCSDSYIKDTSTFIFSLKNYKDTPFRAMCVHNEYSIYGSAYYGPVFGAYDLIVNSFSNVGKVSSSYLSSIYNFPSSQKYMLTGSEMFQIEEIEVYEKLTTDLELFFSFFKSFF